MQPTETAPNNTEALKYSKYLPIWKSLKETGHCRITAPPIYHKRIIKAVRKRRDKDVFFLYTLAEKNYTHRMTYTINGTVIEFRLKQYLSINGL
jgi:hypothetical protein